MSGDRALIVQLKDATRVGPGEIAEVSTYPMQVGFQARRLIIPPANAGFFFLHDVRIGVETRYLAKGPQPILVDAVIDIGDCNPCQAISLLVENRSREEKVFRCAFYGRAVGPYWESIKNSNPMDGLGDLEELMVGSNATD